MLLVDVAVMPAFLKSSFPLIAVAIARAIDTVVSPDLTGMLMGLLPAEGGVVVCNVDEIVPSALASEHELWIDKITARSMSAEGI